MLSVFDELNSISSAEQTGLFPALNAYRAERSDINLQKLCVEMADFFKAVYASTQNERQREIYRSMLSKLNT